MSPSPEPQPEPMGDGFPMNNAPIGDPVGNPSPAPDNAPQDMGNDMTPDNSGSEIDSIYNQLSPDDQKAAKKYAESLLKRDEEARGGNAANGMPQNNPEPPMEEVFHKVNGKLVKEEYGTGLDNACGDECDSNKKPLPKKIATRSKSPFSSPLKK